MAGFVSPTQVEDKFAISLASNVIAERRLQGFTGGGGARIQRARNQVIKDFMQSPPMFEWFWMVDADMVLPKDALKTLLHTAETKKRKLVGGLGYIYKPESNPPFLASIVMEALDDDPHIEESGGAIGDTYIINEPPWQRYVEADATGFFCILIHRSVLEAMHAMYEPQYNNIWIDELEQGAGNTPKGPDMEFFERAKAATGETPLIDTNVKCGHIKKFEITHEMATQVWYANPDNKDTRP